MSNRHLRLVKHQTFHFPSKWVLPYGNILVWLLPVAQDQHLGMVFPFLPLTYCPPAQSKSSPNPISLPATESRIHPVLSISTASASDHCCPPPHSPIPFPLPLILYHCQSNLKIEVRSCHVLPWSPRMTSYGMCTEINSLDYGWEALISVDWHLHH